MTKLSMIAATLAALSLTACATDETTADITTPHAFKVRVENIAPWTAIKSGTQAMKTTGVAGPAGPGEGFDISFTAGKGQTVSFAAMFGQSNDWFFAPGPEGIALYDADGNPISGDVTSQVSLWDAGTEIDQEPGVGNATGPKQPSPEFGAADPDPTVRMIGAQKALTGGGMFTLPATNAMIKVTLVPGADRQFTLRIQNVSTSQTLTTSAGKSGIGISPVVWALSTTDAPLFTVGQADRAEGLEQVAESGNGSNLGSSLRVRTGWATPISPGVFAVHRDPEPLYALGLADDAMGLEALAESGNAAPLGDSVHGKARAIDISSDGTFTTPVGATAAGPAKPGAAYEFEVSGAPGDYLSFATMFGMSNDWFFATKPEGIALFDERGEAMRGDVSADIALYDAGTEIDQEPAIGIDTGPQQATPTSGRLDPVRIVREVSGYSVPASTHLRVTLEPI